MIALALIVAAVLPSGGPPIAGGRPPLGSTLTDFGTAGSGASLDAWADGRIVCVSFSRAGCPVSELYAPTLARIAARFRPSGVAFLGVRSGGGDPAGLDRSIRDDSGAIAARLGAARTPEVVVLDPSRRIRYRGRIDDRYGVGSRREVAGSEDLVAALEDLLAGRAVDRAETEAVGCPIERPDPGPATVPEAGPNYSRDIAPILDRRCVGCHRAGQIGPFPLGSYREAAARAGAIAEAVEDRRMPPWHADPRYGRFANDARLLDPEREAIVRWARSGRPEGDPADLAPPIDRPDGWSIPRPDAVVAMPVPFAVPAEGVVDYQTFEVDPGFAEDRWVRAAEVRPGNRRVVHHCNVFLKAPGSRGDSDAQGDLESACLAETTPGSPPLILPDGMAKRIPAGWRLVFVVHYEPIGTVQEDRTSIGLVFADPATVRKEVATNLLFDPDLRIPPHAAAHRVERARRFDRDVLLLAMFPHMHLRGKSFRYDAIHPDGRIETLLDVPRYDFRWQNRYELARPIRLPAGTTLRCVAHFDNSTGNPDNPDPEATVLAGRQSRDEMFNGYYEIALADQDLTRPPTPFETLALALARATRPLAASILIALALTVGVRSTRRDARAEAGPAPRAQGSGRPAGG